MSKGQTIILGGAYSREQASKVIAAAPAGSVCEVKAPRRTLDQNAKLWAMLSDISRAMPEGRRHTPEQWKCVFMSACGWEVQFLPGLDGNPFPAGFRSSRMTKKQMADLITFVAAYGDEHGVVWSEPPEHMGNGNG